MSHLFSPITLGNLQLENRIVIAPMCQYSAVEGEATSWHTVHLGHLALSGVALLILEATAVNPVGRISPQDLGLWDDCTERALAAVVETVKTHSPIALGIQLAHAGRKASTAPPWSGGGPIASRQGGWQTVAPSALAYDDASPAPQALSLDEIAALKDEFVTAARRAQRIGFQLIELRAARGYLLHQFLSPLTNQRADRYGGSLENRMRLTLEVFQVLRQTLPLTMAVGVRIFATDWVEGGWDEAQSVALAQALKAAGCDYMHVSSGGMSAQQRISVGPGYQAPFVRRIRQETGLTTFAVGMITEPEQAEAIIANGDADAIALARSVLYDPRWPWHAAAKLGAHVQGPKQYWRCETHEVKGLFRRP